MDKKPRGGAQGQAPSRSPTAPSGGTDRQGGGGPRSVEERRMDRRAIGSGTSDVSRGGDVLRVSNVLKTGQKAVLGGALDCRTPLGGIGRSSDGCSGGGGGGGTAANDTCSRLRPVPQRPWGCSTSPSLKYAVRSWYRVRGLHPHNRRPGNFPATSRLRRRRRRPWTEAAAHSSRWTCVGRTCEGHRTVCNCKRTGPTGATHAADAEAHLRAT